MSSEPGFGCQAKPGFGRGFKKTQRRKALEDSEAVFSTEPKTWRIRKTRRDRVEFHVVLPCKPGDPDVYITGHLGHKKERLR